MASFFCHVFGVTKQVRLERIVRPAATSHKELRLLLAVDLMVLPGRQWTTNPNQQATLAARKRTRRKDCLVHRAIGITTGCALPGQWAACLRWKSRCWSSRMNNGTRQWLGRVGAGTHLPQDHRALEANEQQ
jgi:hypothetical protein